GSTVKPSVSLLPPSSLQLSGGSASLLCLLSGYSPQGAQVSWTVGGSEVKEGVLTSGKEEKNGRYSRSSTLTLSKARWDQGQQVVFSSAPSFPEAHATLHLYTAPPLQQAGELVFWPVPFTESLCSPDLEYLIISCTLWLQREISGIITIAMYIPPQADMDQVARKLYKAVNRCTYQILSEPLESVSVMMRCVERKQLEQRTGLVPGETEEKPCPESPHSAQTLQAPSALPQVMHSEQRRIKWPATNKVREWCQFDEDVNQVLEATNRGNADHRMRTMCTMIISIAAERFGMKEQPSARAEGGPNRREMKISQLRQELRLLRKQYKPAKQEENSGLEELRNILRRKLTTLRCAEWHRRRGRERARSRAAFMANPFGVTKKILGQKRSGQLACAEDEINEYLKPTVAFNNKEPNLKEVEAVIKAARSSSAPGPSGVPYVVYKRCPRLLQRLWKIIKVIWRRGKVAQQWRHAEGVWIPKEENASTIEQFRVISLLSVEGKVFFSIVARSLTKFLLGNGYIDTSVQKGGIPKTPGCIEHTGVVTQLIREAREEKGDLAVLWLDLANAYGLTPRWWKSRLSGTMFQTRSGTSFWTTTTVSV
ncbi:hypothetical protein NFI96_004950, partial [Prochilodus magdalenae]